MTHPINIYRKRHIPDEIVHLKDDIILHCEDNLIITKWNTLKPRLDINHGISAYFIDKGIKVSKIFNKNNNLVYWYCDIISTSYDTNTNSYIFEDLLVDVIIYPDGSIKIVDLSELADAIDAKLLNETMVSYGLRNLNYLLEKIYNHEFSDFTKYVDQIEEN